MQSSFAGRWMMTDELVTLTAWATDTVAFCVKAIVVMNGKNRCEDEVNGKGDGNEVKKS